MKNKIKRTMIISLAVVLAILLAVVLFINQPSFGRVPQGARQERIERSPNYHNGEFRNREATALLTSDKSRVSAMLGFLFRQQEGLRPDVPIPAVRTDLQALEPSEELVVWFGHSSYLLQSGGKRFLVDPVFRVASPVSFINKPFEGSDLYKPADMPDIDYLIITHDHWDHLDYQTIRELKNRIGKVICPLGVGEHFERWGFAPEQLVELDWDESAPLGGGFGVTCLTSRHFSGRSMRANQTLWAAYLLQTPSQQIFIGGDGGYGAHFAETGRKFPGIYLAILENGQYNQDWSKIHTMPQELAREVQELGARKILTVHHSKYALARHRWDEPLENSDRLRALDSVEVLRPVIGEVIDLNNQK